MGKWETRAVDRRAFSTFPSGRSFLRVELLIAVREVAEHHGREHQQPHAIINELKAYLFTGECFGEENFTSLPLDDAICVDPPLLEAGWILELGQT